MTVWVEYVAIDNLVINTVLLWFVFRTMKEAVPWKRVAVASVVGTAFALIMPLLTYTGVVAFLVRLFVGAMVVFIVQSRSVARYLLFYLLFLTYTFAFGGAVYGFMFMFMGVEGSLLYFANNSSVPVGVLVLPLATGRSFP